MLAVVLATVVSVSSLEIVRDLVFPGAWNGPAQHVTYALDGTYEYLGTPDGLFRTRRLLDASEPLERVSFAMRPIGAISVDRGVMLVLTGEEEWAFDHSMFRSTDGGRTFTAVDDHLRSCYNGECAYLTGRRIKVDGERVYMEAGGNVFVSTDTGSSWRPLNGMKLEPDRGPLPGYCGDVAFEFVGRRMLLGATDCVSIIALTLTPDRMSIEDGYETVFDTHYRTNAIWATGGATVFAGMNFGLARSDDGGLSFREAFGRDVAQRFFGLPPIQHLVASKRHPNVMIAGGRGAIFCSADGGDSWRLCNDRLFTNIPGLPDQRFAAPSVAALGETRDGELFAVLFFRDRYFVTRINVTPMRRPAARH